MAIIFDKESGFIAEDTATIRDRIKTRWIDTFAKDPNAPPLNTNPETPAGQLIDGETALVAEKDVEVLTIANAVNPKTATGKWQDALAMIYFITRQVAEPTYVTCQVTGIVGTIIPYGALVQSVNGYVFINTAPATIDDEGKAEIIVRCSKTGAINVDAGTMTKIITTIPGWDTVNNAVAGVVGRDEETQAEFEARRYNSVAKNSHGSVGAIYGEVSDVKNVVACKVLENRTAEWITSHDVDIAPHSVYISVYGGEDADIARAIYNKLDGGCGTNGNTELTYIPSDEDQDQPNSIYHYYIQRPQIIAMAVKVVIKQTKNMPTNIEKITKNNILANFIGKDINYQRVQMAETVYASRFYNACISAGAESLEYIEIAYPNTGIFTDSVAIPADQLPVLSENDITVEIVEV